METSLKLITAPTIEPVTRSEAKAALRVDIDDDDLLIDDFIAEARSQVESVTRRALLTQTWEYALDAWPEGNVIKLPIPPLQSVTSVKYTDDDGTERTMDSGDYVVDTRSTPGRIVLKASSSWPSETLQEAAAIVIKFVAGYGDDRSDVPREIRRVITHLVGHWYENREPTVATGAVPKPLPYMISELLQSHRNLRWDI